MSFDMLIVRIMALYSYGTIGSTLEALIEQESHAGTSSTVNLPLASVQATSDYIMDAHIHL